MSKQVKKHTRRRNTNKKHIRRRNTNKKHRNRKKGRGILELTSRKKKMIMKKTIFENAKTHALDKKNINPVIPSKDIYIKCTNCLCTKCNKITDIFKQLKESHEDFYAKKKIYMINIDNIDNIKSADYDVQLKCKKCNKDIDDRKGSSEKRDKINIDLRKNLYKYILYNITEDKRFNIKTPPNKEDINEFYYVYSDDKYLKYILPVSSDYHPSDELLIEDYYHDAILNYYEHFKDNFN